MVAEPCCPGLLCGNAADLGRSRIAKPDFQGPGETERENPGAPNSDLGAP